MKKLFLILSILFLFGCSKKVDEQAVLTTDINVKKNSIEYYEKINLYDLIEIENGSIIDEDYQIDTKELGEKEITIKYKDINDDTLTYSFKISVDDTTAPLIFASKKYSVEKNDNKFNLLDKVVCGDNYDRVMKCEIEGTYDINVIGEYPVKLKTTDTHGNTTYKDTTLIVKDKIKNSDPTYYYLKDFIEQYKKEDTTVGIDVSSWQGTINWSKVKTAGVDAAMIRIGYGSRNKSTMDKRFKENIKNAKKAGLKIGIYYYSYANDVNEAINQAKWIIKELNGENLDLPIAFDWEDWSDFMSYKINFNDLNDIANAFMKEIENNGYKAMNYGSATYHEKVWNTDNYPTWLAYYTDNNDFEEDYIMWQVASDGIVPGINGYVDLDIIKNTIFE